MCSFLDVNFLFDVFHDVPRPATGLTLQLIPKAFAVGTSDLLFIFPMKYFSFSTTGYTSLRFLINTRWTISLSGEFDTPPYTFK